MRLRKIKTLIYNYGEENALKDILYKAKEPLLIHIKGFTDQFDIDYFKKTEPTIFSVFDQHRLVEHRNGDLAEVLEAIKQNKPYRIFGNLLTPQTTAKIEAHVPLWKTIPFRPRFFSSRLKVVYFFGGRGALTDLHFDREHCCNLHLCLSGKKQLLLFTENQSDYLYKKPFIGDALIDFSKPIEVLEHQFPRLEQALGYHVILRRGDMIFLPKNCWHYTRYLEASSSATYVFYPKKILQLYGFLTGYFFLGYDWDILPVTISRLKFFKKFTSHYAYADGCKKIVYKSIELGAYLVLLPLVSVTTALYLKWKQVKQKLAT